MKNILRIATVSLCAMALASLSFAQAAGPKGGDKSKQGAGAGTKQRQAGPPQGRRGGMGAELMEKLGLSADQKKKIEALNQKTQAAIKAAVEKAGGDRAKARDAMRPIMENQRKEMNAILTPAQQEKLKALRKEMIDKFRKENGGTPPKNGPKPPSSKGKGGKTGGGGGV